MRSSEPIRAVIEDIDTQRSYAFTDRSYFELREPFELKLFRLAGGDRLDPDDPLPILLQCAKPVLAARPAAK